MGDVWSPLSDKNASEKKGTPLRFVVLCSVFLKRSYNFGTEWYTAPGVPFGSVTAEADASGTTRKGSRFFSAP